MVDETPVVVMKGSYEYSQGGVTYKVDWVADEFGFRASAPKSMHLPTLAPEHRKAVDAQIKFAEEEETLRAAASETKATYTTYDAAVDANPLPNYENI